MKVAGEFLHFCEGGVFFRMLEFTKMTGAGNDFVLIDNRALEIHLNKEQIARLCDRHFGIGADGLLLVEPSSDGADYRMRYYNSDGGEAEMCGNGARCFAQFARHLGGGHQEKLSFDTPAGIIHASFPKAGEVRINLSDPFALALDKTIDLEGVKKQVHFINTGVPHTVILVENIDDIPVQKWGKYVRFHPNFSPDGTNVNFQEVIKTGLLHVRTYERGVGETLACGTGVVANALIHHLLENAPAPIRVKVKGGAELSVDFKADGHFFSDVFLTGPAEFLFQGQTELVA